MTECELFINQLVPILRGGGPTSINQSICCREPFFTCQSNLLLKVNLTTLGFSGTIPDTSYWNQFQSLSTLILEKNQLTGAIPRFESTSLRMIALSGNRLVGPVPDFTRLLYLEKVYLAYNQLNGQVPFSLMPTSLTVLALESNRLEGPLIGIEKVSNLEELYLDSNPSISGSIPPEFGRLTRLKLFNSTGTGITGSIPESVEKLPNYSSFLIPNTVPSNSTNSTIPNQSSLSNGTIYIICISTAVALLFIFLGLYLYKRSLNRKVGKRVALQDSFDIVRGSISLDNYQRGGTEMSISTSSLSTAESSRHSSSSFSHASISGPVTGPVTVPKSVSGPVTVPKSVPVITITKPGSVSGIPLTIHSSTTSPNHPLARQSFIQQSTSSPSSHRTSTLLDSKLVDEISTSAKVLDQISTSDQRMNRVSIAVSVKDIDPIGHMVFQ